MTKVVSLAIIFHLLACGYLLERYPKLLRTSTIAGAMAYFYAVFVAYAYLLQAFPEWIVPTP